MHDIIPNGSIVIVSNWRDKKARYKIIDYLGSYYNVVRCSKKGIEYSRRDTVYPDSIDSVEFRNDPLAQFALPGQAAPIGTKVKRSLDADIKRLENKILTAERRIGHLQYDIETNRGRLFNLLNEKNKQGK